MNEKINPDDGRLGALLRQSRSSPSLPPRFQENVWRRIEDSEAVARSDSWLDALAALVLRPRFAVVGAAVLVMAGTLLGALQGDRVAHQDAQAQYMNSVAPASMR